MKTSRLLLLVLIVTGAFTAGAVASETLGWRVVATASGSYPSASVDTGRSHGLAVRAYGTSLELSAHFSCDTPDLRVASGQIVGLSIARAKSCSIYTSANHSDFSDNGRIRVQILKR